MYFAKLVPLSSENFLLVGGQSEQSKGSKTNVIKRNVTELSWDRSLNVWVDTQKVKMLRMRVNFAASVLKNGDVVVCGGQTAGF